MERNICTRMFNGARERNLQTDSDDDEEEGETLSDSKLEEYRTLFQDKFR